MPAMVWKISLLMQITPSYASVDGILYNKKEKQPVGRAVRMESNRTDSARNGYADRKRGNGQQPESSEK